MHRQSTMPNLIYNYSSITTVNTRIALPSYHFKALLKEKYENIKKKVGKEGSVSVARLWEEMEGEQVSRIQFEDDLLELEKKQVIILKQILETEKEQKKAIKHPTRGLLGALIWREG